MQFTIIYSPEEHWTIVKALSVAAAVAYKEGNEQKADELTKLATKIEILIHAQTEVAGGKKTLERPPSPPPQEPTKG